MNEIPPMMVMIFLGVFAIIVVAAYYHHLGEKKRSEELTALASEFGWRFDSSRDSGFQHRFGQFDCFKKGGSRYAHNFLSGVWRVDDLQLDCLAGDYHYQTTSSNGKTTSTQTHRFSFLLIRLPYAAAADLRVRPEHFGDKIGAAFGFDDIDFESAEFSRQYHVTSRDKRFAYDLIHPRMIEYLLATTPGEFALDGGWLCVTGTKRRWRPEEFRYRLEWATDFLALWPQHLQTSPTA